jgi:hypothetical protein
VAYNPVITTREQVQDNIKVHGVAWTAVWMRKRKIPFTIAYWLAFGTAPRLSYYVSRHVEPAVSKFYHVLYERYVAQ